MARSRKEKRRRRRIDVGLPIEIRYNKEKLFTRTKNISTLGTYIEADKEISIGIPLNIKIKIPKTNFAKTSKSRQINCKGAAFRCLPAHPAKREAGGPVGSFESKNRYGIGIIFRSFSKEGEKDLSKYIDSVLLQEKKLGKIYIRKRKQKQTKGKGGK